MNIGIISTGAALGEIIETNKDLEKKVFNYDKTKSNQSLDEWLKLHYGIEQRVKTAKLPSSLAYEACVNAVEKGKIEVSSLDFLILNTTSGDYSQPTTATKVQKMIGMRPNSFAIELNMPCAGNIYGLATAFSYIKSGLGKKGLVVGVDRMTSIINKEDFILAGMFGDAASASIVGSNPIYTIENIFLKSKADESFSLGIKSGGSAVPISEETLFKKEHLLSMKGSETASFIHDTIQESLRKLLRDAQLKPSEVGQVVIHQASKILVEKAAIEIGFKKSQLSFTVDKYGNTSSASILLTLDHFFNTCSTAKHIFLVGMGSGLNWGGIALKKC